MAVQVHIHKQKRSYYVRAQFHPLFLAVTRSSKFWSLTCVSAVKTFLFCHFYDSFLSTENAEGWVTAVKIYCSLCTKGNNVWKCLSEEGTSHKLGLPSPSIQTAKTGISARKVFVPQNFLEAGFVFFLEDKIQDGGKAVSRKCWLRDIFRCYIMVLGLFSKVLPLLALEFHPINLDFCNPE